MRITFLLPVLLAACSHGTTPAAHPTPTTVAGTLTGHVHSVGTACATPAPGCDGPAVGYEVVVLAKDGKTEVGRAKTDADGAYRVALSAGEYTIMTPGGMQGPEQRNDVTIATGETATLDLTLDTGVR